MTQVGDRWIVDRLRRALAGNESALRDLETLQVELICRETRIGLLQDELVALRGEPSAELRRYAQMAHDEPYDVATWWNNLGEALEA